MLLATATEYFGKYFGDIRCIEMIAQAGFDAIDYSMFNMSDDDFVLNSDEYLDYAKQLKAVADANGIPFVQAHAPFAFSTKDGEEAFIQKNFIRAKRAIEVAGFLGVKVIVVHPLQHKYYLTNKEYLMDVNMSYYKKLLPYAEKYNVKIACENMWQYDDKAEHIIDSVCADPDEFNAYLDTINSEYFTACLDLGHCGLTSREASYCLRTMGSRVGALHVHDNDYKRDMHTLPGYGNMNWDEIAKALADIDYSGSFTFESDGFIRSLKDEESGLAGLKLMENVGRNLIKKIEQYK